MATSGKRPDPRLIAGALFLPVGTILAAAIRPAVGIRLMVVGIAVIGAGVVAARKVLPPDDCKLPAG